MRFPNLDATFYVDSLFSSVKSIHGQTGGSVLTDGLGFDKLFPWTKKSSHPDALMEFIHTVGIPNTIVSDNALEETCGRSGEIMQEYRIHLQTTVPHSPWQNRAEACIRELKKYVRKVLRQTGAPVRLWTYCATWCAAVRRFTASSIPKMMGRVPETHMNGSTPDISALILFDWYHLVYYLTSNISFLMDKKFVGRFLGIAETCVDEMAFYILTDNGDVIIRKNVWAIPDDKLKQPGANAKVLEMERMLKERFGDTMSTFESLFVREGHPQLY
jgi:hypothetical protein